MVRYPQTFGHVVHHISPSNKNPLMYKPSFMINTDQYKNVSGNTNQISANHSKFHYSVNIYNNIYWRNEL